MDNTVLFMGLPRTPDLFKKSVREISDLRDTGIVDKILFSTWEGRLEDEESLRNFLSEYEVKIIQNREAPVGGGGNIWHQMRALDFGLREIPSNSYVLRTRADVHIQKNFLKRLFTGDIEEFTATTGSTVFNKRIWAPSYVFACPFYIHDICMYGSKRDISMLVNFDARYDHIYNIPKGTPHVRQFIPPYVEEYPFLETYLEAYQHFKKRHFKRDRWLEFIQSRHRSPVFSKFLSFYYKCMYEDFYFNSEPISFDEYEPDIHNNQYISSFWDEFKFDGEEYMFPAPACAQTEWIGSLSTDNALTDVPDYISNGVEKNFSYWKNIKIEEGKLEDDVDREMKYFYQSQTPNNKLVKVINRRFLQRFGLSQPTKKFYLRLQEYFN